MNTVIREVGDGFLGIPLLRDYRRIGEALWQRFNGSKEETLWYYRALVTTFSQLGKNELVEELDRVVTELEQLVSLA